MFYVNAAYEGSHGMSGNDQVGEPAEAEPGRETSETWPSSAITVHMARGAERRRQDREATGR